MYVNCRLPVEDEYIMYFKSLSQLEIALLSKYVFELSFENEYERELYCEFNKYVLSLCEEDKKAIRKLEERIQL